MHKEIAKIESTFLGVEDHGIFTAMLNVNYGGSGQGIGGYSLDDYDPERKTRIGTAFGAEFIKRVLGVCGVSEWEKVKGRTIFVLRQSEGFGSKVLGIASLPTEGNETFLFQDLVKEFYPDADK